MPRTKRADHSGTHETNFKRAKKKIFATQTICGICGKPVDFSIKYPNPLAPCVDHIIPIAKGGHPSDLSNLQLAHAACNRQKSDKLFGFGGQIKAEDTLGNSNLTGGINFKALSLQAKRALFSL